MPSFTGSKLRLPGVDATDILTQQVNTIATAFYATNTIKTLTSQLNKFFSFLHRYKLLLHSPQGATEVPTLTDMHLVFFAGYLVQQGFKSYASISQYTSAVRQWARHNGRQDPAIDTVTQTTSMNYFRFMKALKRTYSGRTTKRVPLTISQLDQLIQAIRTGYLYNEEETTTMEAVLLHAFFGMLRISEYTSEKEDKVKPTWGDITFHQDPQNHTQTLYYTTKIPKSKTDQFGVGHIITTYATEHPVLCPVKAMKKLFDYRKRDNTDPLFSFTKGTNRYGFTTAFDVCMKATQQPMYHIKPHSLRSGGATAYLQTGTEPHIVAKMGRWASFCFTIYTWASTDHLRHAVKNMAHGSRTTKPVNLEPLRLGMY